MFASKGLWALLLAGTVAAAGLFGADGDKKKGDADANKTADALFDRLKGLEGDWEAVQNNDQVKKGQLLSQYRLTGGGTALAETILPGTPMEMLSVYHRDGDQLVMTHYCCVGNQPRMRARQGKDKNEVVFEFTGGTNLNPEKDPHIHGGVVRFIDADHLHAEWDFYVDGKSSQKHSFDLVKRKK
jgi:hypothetical protein